MIFTKPEEYMLPNPQQIIDQQTPPQAKYAENPTKGLSGDPARPPRKQYLLMKQQPLPERQPKFLRSSMSLEDIHGTKSRALYRGVAKDILGVKDIDGSQPK